MKRNYLSQSADMRGFKEEVRKRSKDALYSLRGSLPPSLRVAFGLLLVVCGLLGFLPILGFWMLPLGVALAAPEISSFLRGLKQRKKGQ